MLVDIDQLRLSELRRQRQVPSVSPVLVEQLEAFGQIDPVIVRTLAPKRYEIVRNAEIWLGVQRLGLHRVDILVRDELSDHQASLLVNMSTRLDPIAEARLFEQRLGIRRAHGAVAALAKSYGVSRSYIAHALRLLTLSPELQQALKIGAIKVGHAKALLSLDSAAHRAQFSVKIIQHQWSVNKSERQIRDFINGERGQGREDNRLAHLEQFERVMSEHLGCQVVLNERQGTLVINYSNDLDILDGLTSRICPDHKF